MRKTIRVKDLRIGMYVVLPASWFKHPFLRSEFVIQSKDQIDKIINQGIQEIIIDVSKQEQEPSSFAPQPQMNQEEPIPIPIPPKTWSPETLVPGELIEAIHDRMLPPKIKSKLVYESSKILVERLFEDPKAENIKETRQLTEEVGIIVMQHHEREDGSGYPRGLRENSIHTYSRICCIADVYEALTAKRPYKQPINTFEALKLMKNEMLNHFHQELFEKFVLLFSS